MTALNRDVPPAADKVNESKKEVLKYSVTDKKGIDPSLVFEDTEKMVSIQGQDGPKRQTVNLLKASQTIRPLVFD